MSVYALASVYEPHINKRLNNTLPDFLVHDVFSLLTEEQNINAQTLREKM